MMHACWVYSSTSKGKAVRSFLRNIGKLYHTALRYIPEVSTLCDHRVRTSDLVTTIFFGRQQSGFWWELDSLSPSGASSKLSALRSVTYCHVWGVCVTDNNGFWIGWFDLLALLLQLQSIITAHNQWLLKTRSIPYWTTSVFSSYCDWLGSDLLIGHLRITTGRWRMPNDG
jgi:hypothetical protein